MKKSPEKIMAEMEYIQETIDAKDLEIVLLKKKLLRLEKELAEAYKNTTA